MITHNFKLAWRQLVKYRLQSVVSIVSLAIGFACFALASMWIKYETTYDACHKDADEIHVIMQDRSENMFADVNPQTLRELPQLEQLSHMISISHDSINGIDTRSREWMMNDTNLVSLLGLKFIEGNDNFVHNEHEVAISDRLARKIWGEKSPIGEQLDITFNLSTFINRTEQKYSYNLSRRVSAVYHYWGEHSNFHNIDILSSKPSNIDYGKFFSSCQAIVMARISPKVDMDALNAHLDTMPLYRHLESMDNIPKEALGRYFSHQKMKAVPITELRHATEKYEMHSQTKINHVYLFAISGGMLILCGLLNYLTMFINRLFIRKREIVLRTVFGASGGNLMVQFLTEYGLLLLIALFFGNYAVKLSLDWFLEMSGLPENWNFFHRESLMYILMVFVVSILISVPAIWYFRRQSLQSSITGVGGLMKYNIFRRISTGVQIGISFLCIFCTVVLLKQLNTLRHGDIGFERENRMTFIISQMVSGSAEEIAFFLRQCHEVDTAFLCIQPIYPVMTGSYTTITPDDFPELTESFKMRTQYISEALVDFYGLTLLQGRWLHEGEKNAIMINESLAKKMGWENPLEQSIWGYDIVGVVKDFNNISPTMKAECYRIHHESVVNDSQYHIGRYQVVHYKPGCKQALMGKIEAFFKEQGLFYAPYQWQDSKDEYERMLSSENKLQTLISITTGVCILIALFGVWSMIMLTCEQRRKEIAIRKVHGATVKDILDMFFSEYILLQGIAAIVAFPIGYVCMKPWLEQYVVQTEISWWIYVGIFFAVALLVALCVGWRVWKTANARPADEICKG